MCEKYPGIAAWLELFHTDQDIKESLKDANIQSALKKIDKNKLSERIDEIKQTHTNSGKCPLLAKIISQLFDVDPVTLDGTTLTPGERTAVSAYFTALVRHLGNQGTTTFGGAWWQDSKAWMNQKYECVGLIGWLTVGVLLGAGCAATGVLCVPAGLWLAVSVAIVAGRTVTPGLGGGRLKRSIPNKKAAPLRKNPRAKKITK